MLRKIQENLKLTNVSCVPSQTLQWYLQNIDHALLSWVRIAGKELVRFCGLQKYRSEV